MEKKIMNKFNKMNRCVSGANLNLLRYAMMVVVLLLGVGNAWGGHGGPHYASVSVTAAPSGYGKVYLTTNSSKNPTGDEWKSTMSDTWNCGDEVNDETDTRDYYVHAQAESGYHFVKWSSNNSGTDSKSTANPYTYSTNASGGSGSPTANNIYAIFEKNPVYTATMVVSENGTFKYTYGGSSEVTVTSQHTVQTDQNFTFTALPETGYVVYGWYTKSGNTKNYFEYLSTTIPSFALSSDCEVGVDFMLEGTAVFQIKGTNQYFKDLNEAIAACGSASKIIVPINDGIVPAGNYTIPSNVTLLVPKNATNQNDGADADISGNDYTTQSVFRTLTLASNAQITVNGAIEVASTLCNAYAQGSKTAFPGNCCMTGTYGRMIMNEGSSIVLNSGAKLYAWGLILYDAEAHGSITAKSGSTVYEPFQLTNFSGGSCLDNWYYNRPANTYDFIYSQYYVQNVEVPLTFEYGATEIVQMAINPSSAQDVQLYFIGTSSNSAMFQLTSGAKLTKWYGKAKDRQMYSMSGDASINDLVISIYGYNITTSAYRLPITNNISVNITSGKTTINANAVLFADSEVSIAQGAELVISSGKSVWLYDKDQWGQTYDFISDYIAPLKYAWPKATYRTYSTMDDARLKVDGTITVNGSLFTTTGGAAITSTGTGAISLPNGIVTPSIDPTLHPMTKNGGRNGSNTHANIEVTPAKLKNATQWYSAPYTGDGKACEYLATAGTAASTTINYKNGHWGWVEIWKNGETVLAATNTVAKVNNASAKDALLSGIAPIGYTAQWATAVVDDAKQEVVHSVELVPVTYNITYLDKNGNPFSGTWASAQPTTHTYGTSTTLVNPSKAGHDFDGWYTASDCSGSKVTSLGATSYTADITLYAKWTIKKFTIVWKNGDDVLETDENVPYGATPTYDGDTPVSSEDDEKWIHPHTGWSPEVTSVTCDATYTATYGSATIKMYPVVWKDWNGDTLYQATKGWGWDIPEYKGATPTRAQDGNKVYTFAGWSEPVSEVENGDLTYTARYALSIDVQESQEVTEISISMDEEVAITTIEVKGKLTVASEKKLKTDDLILEASESVSGEIVGNVEAANAYFDLSHEGGFKARTWYAVAVPWQVSVTAKANDNGVYIKNSGEAPIRQKMGVTFDLIYYDGALRASEGHSDACWKFLEDESIDVMEPGHAYMIYLISDADVIRFERKSGTDLHTPSLNVEAHASDLGGKHAHWNGIANPATYHAFINAGAEDVMYGENYGQIYNAEERKYEMFNMSTTRLVVGQPIFVQAPDAKTVVANSASYAPRRAKEYASLSRYELYLAPSLDVATDQLIIRMNEAKETDEYVVGQDLVKMGVSSVVPQMWINRYDSKMCINTMAPVNNTADYPLGISVPQNGEYDIFLDDEPDSESTLYLTYDGEAIWNLSYSAYVASLDKGTNMHYGLRIVKKAPAILTGIEETTIQNGDAIRKVIVNDKVYIIRNGETYSVTGQKTK